MEYIFNINPVPKPRMTQRDKWANRPVVTKYFGFATLLRLHANKQGLKTLQGEIESLVFFIPMAKSWSDKKKAEMNGKPHEQRPDLSNLLKSIEDILCKDDSHIWKYENLEKRWNYEGKIVLLLK